MRLIDADKLMLSLEDWKLQEEPISTYPKPKEFTADDMQRMIWRTIRDCESAVEEQPTVKAIPVEWIKNYARHKASKGFTEIDCYWQSWEDDVLKMVTAWEKENETN